MIDTQSITSQTGTKSIAFTTSDTDGVYYTALIRTTLGSGSDVWLAYDTCELVGYIVMRGTVYDAETASPIAVSNVSIVQGSLADNSITIDGNYTTTKHFLTGSLIAINVTATGYKQYTQTFTPLYARTIDLNFTLIPTSPTVAGIGINGIDRDSTYYRPISSATVTISNATYGESWTALTNSVGYYLLDESDGAMLTNGRWYSVQASKTGFSNSAAYLVQAVGT